MRLIKKFATQADNEIYFILISATVSSLQKPKKGTTIIERAIFHELPANSYYGLLTAHIY